MTTSLERTTRAELVGRARELAPAFRERANKTEQLHHVPEENVADLRNAGLLRVATPAMYGGYSGLDFDACFEISEELARGCASTAWCYTNWQSHNWMIGGMLSAQAREEYFAEGPDVISSTASAPVSLRTEILDTGYKLSGHWQFSSGADHATWFLVSAKTLLGNCLVPRSDIEVLDTWRSFGLRGTGSHDVRGDDIAVPYRRLFGFMDQGAVGGPMGWRLHERATYRLQQWMLVNTILAPIVGASRAMVELFEEQHGGRRKLDRYIVRGSMSPNQMRLAEASAEVDTARLVLRTDLDFALDRARRSVPFTLLERARIRRNHAFAVKLCVQAVTRLYEVSGAHGLAEGNDPQRNFRDVVAGSHHTVVPIDQILEMYGQVALGTPRFEGFRDGIDPLLMVD